MEQPPKENEEVRREEWALTDIIKRALVAGVGALFMTEEGIRSFLTDMKLPKEAVQFVVSQVSKTKQDLFNVLSGELRQFLESTNLADELRKVLVSTSLEISTNVRFVPVNEKLQPRIKSSVKVDKDSKAGKEKESNSG